MPVASAQCMPDRVANNNECQGDDEVVCISVVKCFSKWCHGVFFPYHISGGAALITLPPFEPIQTDPTGASKSSADKNGSLKT